VRYLLIASEPWRFGESIIAELRGLCGAHGSPLYDYLFQEKLEKTFLQADAEYYDRNPDALGDIVPIGEISTESFPLDVKASLGQPHPSGMSAMRLLQSEGFIFSHRDTIRTIMKAQSAKISASPSGAQGEATLIASGKVGDFRAVLTPAQIGQNGVLVLPDALHALQAPPGSDVRFWKKENQPSFTQTNLVKAHI